MSRPPTNEPAKPRNALEVTWLTRAFADKAVERPGSAVPRRLRRLEHLIVNRAVESLVHGELRVILSQSMNVATLPPNQRIGRQPRVLDPA
ncbi:MULTISPECIES: hypothetical protein [Pseudomonas aeruginosa group]|uniref:hypothetical protein n=1 Tax=Pseudomonas aeruginosa group TaxID=136841 RepID=UPI000B19194F|nr:MULTISPECIES: hypothetical protein [Pseudomonas aeruginosa group]MDT1027311.1 hypothetical protein [Pseudomonas paraeruginosa]QQV47331.1 hypothetical protein JHW37_22285 [Pseudomonas aeruginosa]VTL97461.1 Uncharacterised protein [Pseudomonas aeruginosa]